ncbi:protein kinase domain-containing protein [Streptomyces niveus]|uniref:serine/threonine-protein kinase n=1 Tax=Streptomyces niveus TaxID=193462 RepID=UPI0036E0BEA8
MLRPLDAFTPAAVGPFRLIAGLGSGGMGTVHLALPPGGGPGDLVALKTTRQDLAFQEEFRLRFRREAEAARAVRSPYVAALVDADPAAERPWLATEYVVGPSLDEAVDRSGPLSVAAVRELGADLTRGLSAVHGARLVHRDLKPGNVILGTAGPRLIDFGIAQAYDATALTATGVMVGSPGFMSPEHVAADRSVTAASDVFCLGAVLCFAATGRGPFHDDELAAVVNRIARDGADLSRVPQELREVIASCLRTDPEQRPTTGELLRTLDPEGAAAARPGVAPPPREGAFPWPEGVRRQIGEYEVAVGRALLAPVPVPAPPVPPVPERAPAPPVRARGNRLRWAIGVGAAAVVGSVAAVLFATWGDGSGNDSADGTGKGGSSERPAPAAVTVTSQMSDFGPAATDRAKAPDGWSPWSQQPQEPGEPRGCALNGTTLVCSYVRGEWRYQERAEVWLEARDASDGTPKWRYPAKGTVPGVATFGQVEMDAERVYTLSPDGDGFTVLDIADGMLVARLSGEPGYRPTTVRLSEGRVFTSFEGASGEGAAGNMLFRAFAADSHRQLWQRQINRAYPQTLDVVADGERLFLGSPTDSFSLDPATGKTLATTPHMCVAQAEGGQYVSCDDELMRDSGTLKVADVYFARVPEGYGRQGTVFVAVNGNELNPQGLAAHDTKTGERRWATEYAKGDIAVVAGDRLLVTGPDGLRSLAMSDGEQTAVERAFEGWPENEAPTRVLVSGGALFLAFADGTVLSAHVP